MRASKLAARLGGTTLILAGLAAASADAMPASRGPLATPVGANRLLVLVSQDREQEIFETVRALAAEILMVPADDIRLDSTFAEDLGADELDMVELVIASEEKFDISIDDEIAERLATVGDLVAAIAELSKN